MNAATLALATEEPLAPEFRLVPPEPACATDASPPETLPDSARPLSVVIAYEDAGTRDRAIDVCQGTIQQQWRGFKLDCTWWKFDLLHHPAVAEAAVEAAAEADLFICSVRAENDLPAVVKAWVERWLPKQTEREGALIVLVEGRDDEPAVRAPAVSYLQRVASAAKMTFFARFFKRRDEPANFSPETLRQSANVVTDVLSEILSYRGGFPHGGINE
jgi:hypothetical protein